MNSFKKVVPGLFFIVFYAINVDAVNLSFEEAVESESLKISLNEETGMGVIYGKVCDECEELTLTVTPETRAYEGTTQVGLAQAKGRLGMYATVIFNKETREVIRIRW